MPSAKQIAARKAFVKKYAKKGKRKLKTGKGITYDKRASVFQMAMGNKSKKKNASGNLNQTRKRMRKR